MTTNHAPLCPKQQRVAKKTSATTTVGPTMQTVVNTAICGGKHDPTVVAPAVGKLPQIAH